MFWPVSVFFLILAPVTASFLILFVTTAFFFSCLLPTLFFGRLVAASAVPIVAITRAMIEITRAGEGRCLRRPFMRGPLSEWRMTQDQPNLRTVYLARGEGGID